jgi:hypothetical protein
LVASSGRGWASRSWNQSWCEDGVIRVRGVSSGGSDCCRCCR